MTQYKWLTILSVGLALAPTGEYRKPANWALIPFTKVDSVNPVLSPGQGVFTDPLGGKRTQWEARNVFNPAIVVREGKIYMLYRAQDSLGISRIGFATSGDGFHFQRRSSPVLYPDADTLEKYEAKGGCEDPRIVEDDQGNYYMTYTAYDGQTARLAVATSPDLLRWTKRGLAFARGHYINTWSKSGSIVSRYVQGKIIATRINGKYWMYWGDKFIWAAVSDNLIDWSPVEISPGVLRVVITPRRGKFDSDLVEPGPPALLTDHGILLMFNGRNLLDGTYSGSQGLMEKKNPLKMLVRLDQDFIHPDKPYELSGQVGRVCFLEGLASLHGKWFLYYGTADSRIAVAVKE